jgi:hypothetical protein
MDYVLEWKEVGGDRSRILVMVLLMGLLIVQVKALAPRTSSLLQP